MFVLVAILAVGSLIVGVESAFSDCGPPPPVNQSYSSNYQRAQTHYFCTSFCPSGSGSASGAYGLINGSASGSYQSCQEQCSNDTLSEAEAAAFVQAEYQNQGAQIVSECSYRMCKLLEQGVSEDLKIIALGFQNQVCSTWSTPTGQAPTNASAYGNFTATRTVIPLTFFVGGQTSTDVTLGISNVDNVNSAQALLYIDQGPIVGPAGATGLVSFVSTSGRTKPTSLLRLSRASSKNVVVRVNAPPTAGQVYSPQLVIQQKKDATKSTRVQFVIRLVDPNAGLPAGFRRCLETEGPNVCPGTPFACALRGDDADQNGGDIALSGTSEMNGREILFGEWANTQCGTSGSGWHVAWGSCGTNQGTRHKRCASVIVYNPNP
jgi:hypothetical protein